MPTRRGIRYEVLSKDPDLGVIVRATDPRTGETSIGAASPPPADMPFWSLVRELIRTYRRR